jgi:outer membrane protein assembly factor BamE
MSANDFPHVSFRFSSLMAGLSLMLCACATQSTGLLETLSPYRIEIVQGNFVSKEQVAALQPGMTRNQVRDILGTALLASIFHSDRWDYAFTLSRQGLEPQARRMSVFFKGDAMLRVEGDEMPSESEFVTKLESSRNLGKVPLLKADAENLKQFAPATPPISRAAPAPVAPQSYPPLEASTR